MTTEARDRPDLDLPTGQATFLFTDVEGSTRLSQAVGDAFADVIDRHHRILRTAITEGGAIVVSTEGDAFFAIFTAPAPAVMAEAIASELPAGLSLSDLGAIMLGDFEDAQPVSQLGDHPRPRAGAAGDGRGALRGHQGQAHAARARRPGAGHRGSDGLAADLG